METENFRDKYEKSGILGQTLIRNFYRSVGIMIHRTRLSGGRVLEVGVGEGYSTTYLRPLLPGTIDYHASEIETVLLSRAKNRNHGIQHVQESVYQLARKTACYDLVICLEVLEHLTEPERALKELCRVSQGFVIISVPREPIWRALNMMRGKYLSDWGNTPGHIQHWSSDGIEKFAGRYATVKAVRRPLPWTVLLLETTRQS